ncbi:Gfo/Idh/MocA family protein [Tautonia plasticadhaerens]|uniref:1,5-anhydro-D-fructose reductase n=1 Tax=Tautonia plasticadhaerens TaxID=2527974 RepID=A0A518H4J4_9BACT|nr:Gfo/Idh/MocA family oxidoreductase [Tautonia plasticadhaerens]QDV35758.1 1,5-anhydro-D-fructose reductase [Tautonia plasticadhaerens]
MSRTSPDSPSRRGFLRSIGRAAAAGVAVPMVVPASALGRGGFTAPSERITLAMIGTGNQGFNDLRSFLRDDRVQVVAVCDVNREGPGYWDGKVGGREPAKRLVEEHYGRRAGSGSYAGCASVVDFREILGRDDIDAVEICTPDHWHAIPVIEACKAGKDIYCQKPLSLTIAEGRAMSDAVKETGVVFQTGSQQRSDPNFRRACELVRNGRIGELKRVLVGLPGGRPNLAGEGGDDKKTAPVPEGFEYDSWLGPAPEAPYAPARCHVNFRWILDYSGGQITDWGGHHPDCAQWGMGTERTGPVEIRNVAGTFEPPDPLWDTATAFSLDAVYGNGVVMNISNANRMGVTFEGTEGTVHADRGRIDADPKSLLDSEIGPGEIRLYASDDHFRNFIDCVHSRGPTAAPVEVAHRSITVCHLGNIALRLGRDRLRWDPDAERILGDDEAAAMLSRPYRDPWKLPVV